MEKDYSHNYYYVQTSTPCSTTGSEEVVAEGPLSMVCCSLPVKYHVGNTGYRQSLVLQYLFSSDIY